MSAFSDYIDKKFTQLSKTAGFRQFIGEMQLNPDEKAQATLGYIIGRDKPCFSGSRLVRSQKLGARAVVDSIDRDGCSFMSLTEIASICGVSQRTVVSGAKKIPNIPKLSDLKVTIENDRVTLTPIKK